MTANIPCAKMLKIKVDAHQVSANMTVPREAGLLHFGVRSTYILGLQIGTQFCPGLSRPAERDGLNRKTRLSFFVV